MGGGGRLNLDVACHVVPEGDDGQKYVSGA